MISQVKKQKVRRASTFRSSLDIQIESLYTKILQKQKSGYEISELLGYNEDTYNCIHYIMLKPVKNEIELSLMKLYLYSLKKFMAIFKDFTTSIDELMSKICIYLKCEEIKEDKVIFKQGDKGDKFYLILKGTIGVLIQKEQIVKMSKIDYLKYLTLLNLYQENDLINRIILVNKTEYYIEEKYLYQLFILFRVFKYYLDNNPEEAENTKDIQDFFNREKEVKYFIQEKFENSADRCLKIMDLDDFDITTVYLFYSNILDMLKVEQLNIMNNNFNSRNSFSHNKIINVKNLSKIEQYDRVISSNDLNADFINSVSKDGYCDRLSPPSISTSSTDSDIKIFNYVEVVTLSEGNIFGDIALQNSSKKRTATIITKSECCFGTLTKSAYDFSLKSAQDKIRFLLMSFFLNSPPFKGINQNIFELKYFNWFKEVELNKSTVLFKQNSEMKSIYFIRTGEIEMTSTMTFGKLNEIIKQLGGKVNEFKERKLTYESYEFLQNYQNKKHNFKICLLNEGDIAGLDEFIFNGKYFCNCIVSTSKSKVFELEEYFYQNLLNERDIRINIENYIKIKKNILAERLINVKETKINNMMNKMKKEKEFMRTLTMTNNKKEKKKSPFKSLIYRSFDELKTIMHNIPEKKLNTESDKITKEKFPNIIYSPNKLNISKTQFSFNKSTMTPLSSNTHAIFQRNTPKNQKNIHSITDFMSSQSPSRKKVISLKKNKHFLYPKKKREQSFSLSENLMSHMIHRYQYNTLRSKKIIISNKKGKLSKTLKELRIGFVDKKYRKPSEGDDFYFKNQELFQDIISPNKKEKSRNTGIIDFLILDKWAEKNFNSEKDI